MVTPDVKARVVYLSGITSLVAGKFIIQGIHCYGADGGNLVDAADNVIASFGGEGSIAYWKKFEVDGLGKTSGLTSDMYVYLDTSVPGGGVM